MVLVNGDNNCNVTVMLMVVMVMLMAVVMYAHGCSYSDGDHGVQDGSGDSNGLMINVMG